jgi:hypothetical protein
MATTILSGRQLILSVNGVNYSEQITSSAINFDTERLTFDTLAGKAYKYIDSNVTLDVEFLNDAGTSPNSLYKVLWDGTETAPRYYNCFHFDFTNWCNINWLCIATIPKHFRFRCRRTNLFSIITSCRYTNRRPSSLTTTNRTGAHKCLNLN